MRPARRRDAVRREPSPWRMVEEPVPSRQGAGIQPESSPHSPASASVWPRLPPPRACPDCASAFPIWVSPPHPSNSTRP